MKRGKRLRWGLLMSAAGMLLFCSAAQASAQSPPKAKGKLTVAFGAESNVLDVTRAAAGVDWYINSQIYEMLMAATPKLEKVNWLAEKWKIAGTAEKPVIDIQLRKDVKFHTGDPMTADDFVFAYERFRDPKISKWAHYQASVDHIEVVDDHHFKIHFKEPDATYVSALLRLYAVSRAYFKKAGDEGMQQHPVGTGPWKFVSRKVKEEFRLEAFDDYWNQEHRPTVKELTIKIIPEDMTRVAAFKTGEVAMIDAVPPAMIADIKKMKGVRTTSLLNGNNLFIQLPTHMKDSPFMDVRVRLAAAHAIDMDGIIEKVLYGQGVRYASVGKGTMGYDPTLKPYSYDPEKAKALLKEAGYPKGFDVKFYNLITPREPYMKEMGEAIAAYLTAAGIRCKIQGMEYAVWINLGARRKPPELDGIVSWMWGHGLVTNPGDAAWPGHLHCYKPGTGWGSYSYWCDPEFDRLIEEQKRIMDPVKREALLKKIGRMKHEQVAGGICTYRPLVTFAWKDFVDYTPWPGGYYHQFQEIGLRR